MNQPPEYCPYCGTAIDPVATSPADAVETPSVFECGACDDYVFYNPAPGGSAIVVDGGRLLLVEDFRTDDAWKLPSGRVELGESYREGVVRELAEETNLAVDPEDLVYVHDEAGEPVPDQHMVNVEFAVDAAATTGVLAAGSDATDARFFAPSEFAASDRRLQDTHVDRFGEGSLPWLLDRARTALDRAG